jgi:3-deoxy-D-manno-octulosonic-acid transferase
MERATPRVVLYNIVLFVVSPVLLVVFLLHAVFDRRVREGHLYRCGLRLPQRPRQSAVWIHAVSVGEVTCVKRLVEMILAETRYEVYLSTTTATGFETAQRIYKDTVTLFYFPVDHRFVIRRFLDAIQPAAVIIAEVEIWPNFLDVLRRRGIPTYLVNGRIGAKELAGYRRLRWFFRPFYAMYRRVLAQSEGDRARMIEIGMPERLVGVARNLKEESTGSLDREKAAALRRFIPQDRVVVVAGSTHAPEEQFILSACRSLGLGQLFLVIAPRHVERGEEIRRISDALGFSTRLLREARDVPTDGASGDALIVNTMGDLLYFYERADLVIMGGSFCPTVGGHNFLEPLFFGKPVVTGPCMDNFLDLERHYASHGGIVTVDAPERIGAVLEELIHDEARRTAVGARGRALLLNGRGGTEETYRAIFGASGIAGEPGAPAGGPGADERPGRADR